MAQIILFLLLSLVCLAPTLAAEPMARPILVLDPGMHVAPITALSTDASGETAATASQDGTVRIWDTAEGSLLRTIRVPQGAGNIGTPYSIALSPDGRIVAVAGWTRYSDDDRQEQVYFFGAGDGTTLQRIEGLPNVVHNLAFRNDGARLAAVLGGNAGMRLYSSESGQWREVGRHAPYGARGHSVAFALDGSFATTSFDGHLRTYSADGHLLRDTDVVTGKPYSLAFSPDGSRLAVGFLDGDGVEIFDAATLAATATPELPKAGSGDLTVVDWTTESGLRAAGTWHEGETAMMLGWSAPDLPPVQAAVAGHTVSGVQTLPDGDVLIASMEPSLLRLSPDGARVWENDAVQIDPVDQHSTLAVSKDGSVVDFQMARGGERVRFDTTTQTLVHGPANAEQVFPPNQDALPITDWNDAYGPELGGGGLGTEPLEMSRSLAIRPDGGGFVIGTDWYLRAYDSDGEPLWKRIAPSAVWALNMSGDGRLLVAAYGDGTIRWHRMDDGVELLALFVLPETEDWVIWTPEGVYNATSGARAVLRWLVNRGWDAGADAVPAYHVSGTSRSDVIPLVLPHLGTDSAVAMAERAKRRLAVQAVTGASVPPGAQLHLLTIGVADYNDEKAEHLDLDFADDDAADLAGLLIASQGGLYSNVNLQMLLNDQATHFEIMRALDVLERGMAGGNGNDIAVIHFSGHGATLDGDFYLLPHDVDATSPLGLSVTAIEVTRFQRRIAEIAALGRVVLLLDACRSGASTAGGQSLQANGERLKSMLYGANISVLTSSSADQDSREDDIWKNGAFTEALLEALGGNLADLDYNGVLTMTELTDYVTPRVESLTEGRQTPSFELRFRSAVFVTGS